MDNSMKIGYARCSTSEQNLDWQLDALKKEGCEKIYQEKISGMKKDRPELLKMLDALRKGDTVIVCELTRLSRSTKDLFELVEKISTAGANIKSLKEAWLDTTTPQGKLLFTIFAGVSQFERDLTYQRTMDGLAAARARGRLGGRPKTDPMKIQQALVMYEAKNIPIKDILQTTGISRATLYNYLKYKEILNENKTGVDGYRTEYSEECRQAVEAASKHPLSFDEAKKQVERKRRMSELGNQPHTKSHQ